MRKISDHDKLLVAAADIISERIHGMQAVVDSIAELARGKGRLLPEIVVAFQAFDRLTQEFDILADVIRAYASLDAAEREQSIRSVIDSIRLSELKGSFVAALADQTEDDILSIGANSSDGVLVF